MRQDKDLLTSAMHEIRHLRRSNELLSAKVSVVDVFAAACGMRRDGGMMSEDIAWAIEKRLQQMTAEEEKKPEKK